jgi:hypothetical protein
MEDLLNALSIDDLTKIKTYIPVRFSPNDYINSENKETIFSYSILRSRIQTVKLLHEFGGNFTKGFDVGTLSQIKLACNNIYKDDSVLAFVLETTRLAIEPDEEGNQQISEDILNSAIAHTCTIGYKSAMKLLIKYGANASLVIEYFLDDPVELNYLDKHNADFFNFAMSTKINPLPKFVLDSAILSASAIRDKKSVEVLMNKGANGSLALESFLLVNDQSYVTKLISLGAVLSTTSGILERVLSLKFKHPLTYALLPNCENESHVAVVSNDINKVKDLFKNKKLKEYSFPYLDPLILLASKYASLEMVKLLISMNFNPHVKSAVVRNPNFSMISTFNFEENSNNVSLGNETILTTGLDRGFDKPLLDYLLTLKVDVNYNTANGLNILNFPGKTPLSIAVRNGNAESVEYLLKNKANPNAIITQNICTAGHLAIQLRKPMILMLLIQYKIDYKNIRYPKNRIPKTTAGMNIKELAKFSNDCKNPYSSCLTLMV